MKKNLAIISISLAAFCSAVFIADSKADELKSTIKTVTPVYNATETKEFKVLTRATLDALAAGKSSEMVAKLTDLETIWDDQENVLKPKDEKTWTMLDKTLDKTLDKAISVLRSSHVNLPKGKAALEDLLEKLEAATKL
jgi:hypothetical protein